jgi:hypothetical protein
MMSVIPTETIAGTATVINTESDSTIEPDTLILFVRPEIENNEYIAIQPTKSLANKIRNITDTPFGPFTKTNLETSLMSAMKTLPITMATENYIKDVIRLADTMLENIGMFLPEKSAEENPITRLKTAIATITAEQKDKIQKKDVENIIKQFTSVLNLCDKITVYYSQFTQTNQFEDKIIPAANNAIITKLFDKLIEIHTKLVEKYKALGTDTIEETEEAQYRGLFAEITKSIEKSSVLKLQNVTKKSYTTFYEANHYIPQTILTPGIILYIESNKENNFENRFKLVFLASHMDIELAIQDQIQNNLPVHSSCTSLLNKHFYNMMKDHVLTKWGLDHIIENYKG